MKGKSFFLFYFALLFQANLRKLSNQIYLYIFLESWKLSSILVNVRKLTFNIILTIYLFVDINDELYKIIIKPSTSEIY